MVATVASPIMQEVAVETSAAQRPARVNPATQGFRLDMSMGKARLALSSSGCVSAAMIPITAHRKPMGTIRTAAMMVPYLAAFSLLPAAVAWIRPWLGGD